jgi:hypothetical protein
VLSRIENQALHKGDFPRVEQVQDEKELIREQIDELEPIPEGGVSRHAADEAVKRVVSQIMQLDRENNEKLLQQMGVLKAEAESQSQTRTTLRRVQGAYAKRLSSAHWEAYT